MRCYSVQARDKIFVKGYEFLSFAKNMSKNIGESISKNLSNKYSQKPSYMFLSCHVRVSECVQFG